MSVPSRLSLASLWPVCRGWGGAPTRSQAHPVQLKLPLPEPCPDLEAVAYCDCLSLEEQNLKLTSCHLIDYSSTRKAEVGGGSKAGHSKYSWLFHLEGCFQRGSIQGLHIRAVLPEGGRERILFTGSWLLVKIYPKGQLICTSVEVASWASPTSLASHNSASVGQPWMGG